MRGYPFTAVVGSDDMRLALILTTISPAIGGVLVRGEKGTAKSTTVRALAELLPDQQVVEDCRFGCAPANPDANCPDGPHSLAGAVSGAAAPQVPATEGATRTRPARLVELPVGATEDRVIGSLDLQQALGHGAVHYEPGLLAQANRGILYVDEVNLLHDHLVDLLLDAAAMGRNTVERDGVSITHAARIVLIGTMNPEEGELRPQLLDRFGLTVEVVAPRDPALRVDVVRRRLEFEADPETFAARFDAEQQRVRDQLSAARDRLEQVKLGPAALLKIAEICAAFEVDGMRADIVTARAATAHAAWRGAERVDKNDIRAAARLALPHRRRRDPFDAPGLDEELLDQLLADFDEDPDPPEPTDPQDPGPDQDGPAPEEAGPDDSADMPDQDAATRETDRDPQRPAQSPPAGPPDAREGQDSPVSDVRQPEEAEEAEGSDADGPGAAPRMVTAAAGTPYRTRRLEVRGLGAGDAGNRSRALTSRGRTVGAGTEGGGLHLPATVQAAAPHQVARGRTGGRLRLAPTDLRHAITEGRESNLVLLVVDASGSMAARRRMEAVKTAVLSLLLDAYQRRDKVGLVTFRDTGASLALPPTTSVDAAARRLAEMPSGGRTPLAEGLLLAARVLERERVRDPRRRPLLVLLTDGRATAGADALARSRRVAGHLAGVDAVVIDCETGRFRLGLAAQLAALMGADLVELGAIGRGAGQVARAADTIVETVTSRTESRTPQPVCDPSDRKVA